MIGKILHREKTDEGYGIQIERAGPGAKQPFVTRQIDSRGRSITFSRFLTLDQAIGSAASYIGRNSTGFRDAERAAQARGLLESRVASVRIWDMLEIVALVKEKIAVEEADLLHDRIFEPEDVPTHQRREAKIRAFREVLSEVEGMLA